MAYSNYLVKIGNMIIPLKFFQYDSYQATFQMIDVDSGESTQSGALERTVLHRRKMKVEWTTPPISDPDLQELLDIFRNRWIDADAQKCHVTAYIPYCGDYKEDDCYLTADMNFQIRIIENGTIYYEPIRFALIGYTTSSATL